MGRRGGRLAYDGGQATDEPDGEGQADGIRILEDGSRGYEDARADYVS